MPDVMAKLNDQPGMEILGSCREELASLMRLEMSRRAGRGKKSGVTASWAASQEANKEAN